jgi:GNAT superfamily N-acetyltransferase
MAMRLLPIRENKSYMNQCIDMYTDSTIESDAEIGQKKKRDDVRKDCERKLYEHLSESNREVFLFEKGKAIVGFAEILLEEECFPDEDLPEVCVKLICFYICPQHREQKLGTEFFKLIRKWGRDKEAALIEAEVASYHPSLNHFLMQQGLELVGSGEKNCYRAFI